MRTRLERAVDKRDDRQAYLDKWSFGMLPSEIRRRERGIERAQNKIDRLNPPTPTTLPEQDESTEAQA
jgi:hypothetical protein